MMYLGFAEYPSKLTASRRSIGLSKPFLNTIHSSTIRSHRRFHFSCFLLPFAISYLLCLSMHLFKVGRPSLGILRGPGDNCNGGDALFDQGKERSS